MEFNLDKVRSTILITTNQQIRQELEMLIKQGTDILTYKQALEAAKELVKRGKGKLLKEKNIDLTKQPDRTTSEYQRWYTQSLPVVRQLLPDRYLEFQELYRVEAKRKELDPVTYAISDYLAGITVSRGDVAAFNSFGVFAQKFQSQVEILASALTRIDSILVNIKAVLQAELFDDELSVASEQLKKSHFRAAGAIAGVVIERHLGQVAIAHTLTIRKETPTISDLNDALKTAGVFDVPEWRFIQRLGDIRNLCVHSKKREPTKDEVEDLIRGAEKVIKTIF